MRQTFILLLTAAVLISLPINVSGKPKHDKEKKKITLFASQDRKSLIRERDSLVLANEALMMELDSLYRKYADLEVYEELAEADRQFAAPQTEQEDEDERETNTAL